MKIALAICGSFCNHAKIISELENLVYHECDITPVFSANVTKFDTRFGTAEEFTEKIEALCGKKAITDIVAAEKIITSEKFDCVAIAPCTGNTLAKIALGLTEGAVPMAAKAQLRTLKPVVIALATNDGLAASLPNLALLLSRKNIYFVPMKQDNSTEKPSSLVCDFSKLYETILSAVNGIQIQPILI